MKALREIKAPDFAEKKQPAGFIARFRAKLTEADLRTQKALIQRDLVKLQTIKVRNDLGWATRATGQHQSKLTWCAAIGMLTVGVIRLRSGKREASAAQVEELKQLIEAQAQAVDQAIEKVADGSAEKADQSMDAAEQLRVAMVSFTESLAARIMAQFLIVKLGIAQVGITSGGESGSEGEAGALSDAADHDAMSAFGDAV